jgi:hypothetical protein
VLDAWQCIQFLARDAWALVLALGTEFGQLCSSRVLLLLQQAQVLGCLGLQRFGPSLLALHRGTLMYVFHLNAVPFPVQPVHLHSPSTEKVRHDLGRSLYLPIGMM